jgi:hypothetical protein
LGQRQGISNNAVLLVARLKKERRTGAQPRKQLMWTNPRIQPFSTEHKRNWHETKNPKSGSKKEILKLAWQVWTLEPRNAATPKKRNQSAHSSGSTGF